MNKKERIISLIATGVIATLAVGLGLKGELSDKDDSPPTNNLVIESNNIYEKYDNLKWINGLEEQRQRYIKQKEYEEYLAYVEYMNYLKYEEERKRLAKIEAEKKEKQSKQVSSGGVDLGVFNASFYTSSCYKCSGVSKSGVDLRGITTYQGYKIAASDWNVIPAYSIIEVEGYGQYIVLDTGGKIRGKSLDLLVATKDEAYKNGRQNLKVKLIRKGKG